MPLPYLCIDSPVIYGDRVETSKPYHLIYTDILFICRFHYTAAYGGCQLELPL